MKKLSIILIAIAIVSVLLAAGVAMGGYDDPPWEPTGGGAEWVVTSYSAASQDECDASAGEICKEWCLRTPRDNLIPTGDLCCVVGQTCRTPR